VAAIRALIDSQQLRKARALAALLPDTPENARRKKLLRLPVASTSPRRDVDRTVEYRWLRDNAKDYRGKWVAVSGDALVASADTLRELREAVTRAAPQRAPLLLFVE